MDILRHQFRAFTEFRGDSGKLMKPLKRAAHVLHALSSSTTLDEGVGPVCRIVILGILILHLNSFPFAKPICAAFAILLAVCLPLTAMAQEVSCRVRYHNCVLVNTRDGFT